MTLHRLLVLALFLLATIASAGEPDSSHRDAAMALIGAFEVKSIDQRGKDVAMMLVQGGLAPPDAVERLAQKCTRLLGSEKFIDGLATLYMAHFSEDEMRRIAVALKDPAMQRFLADRLSIMQDGMSQLAELFDEFGITEELINTP